MTVEIRTSRFLFIISSFGCDSVQQTKKENGKSSSTKLERKVSQTAA